MADSAIATPICQLKEGLIERQAKGVVAMESQLNLTADVTRSGSQGALLPFAAKRLEKSCDSRRHPRSCLQARLNQSR